MRHVMAAALLLAAALPAAARAQEVLHRETNQQQRISQGVRSGQITAGGAAGLERQQARINASRNADRAANGGHLTPQEYRNLNHRENLASRRIYVDKHNGIAQPGVVPR